MCAVTIERLASVLIVISLTPFVACGSARGTVGARFGRDADGHVYVREVPKGLGASNAGIQSGDEVILIDGRDVRMLSDDELHRVLSGNLGEPVCFTVLRGNEVVRMTIARTPVPNSKSNP